MTFTMDDYFRRRMFKGDIIKTQNLLNQPLQAYCPTPDSLKKEQERIENQLVAFEKALWFQPDTTAQAADKEETKKSKKSSRKSKDEGVKQEEAPKAKTVKAPKPERSSTPVRSVRRR